MRKYWFARIFPVEQTRNTRVAPVSSEGWAVVTVFIGCLVAAAVGLLTISFTYREPGIGVAVFIGFAALGSIVLVAAVMLRSDRQHTIEDYKQGRVRQS